MSLIWDNGVVRLYQGDAAKLPLEDESVDCVVTSPPYWNLRDYQTPGQLGLEPTPEEYVENMVIVFREVRRVLKPTGVCWINLGDSYATDGAKANNNGTGASTMGWPGQRPEILNKAAGMKLPSARHGLKPKDLVGIPWLVAFALRADGWYLRSDIIWAKPNPMPESVTDRPTKAHEYLFLLSKRANYYYDAEAIREKAEYGYQSGYTAWISGTENGDGHRSGGHGTPVRNPETGRNRRTVWEIATQPMDLQVCHACGRVYDGVSYRRLPENEDRQKICHCGAVNWSSHFATYPEALVEPCILAGSSKKGVCGECGKPWVRVIEREFIPQQDVSADRVAHRRETAGVPGQGWQGSPRGTTETRTTSWAPTCTCNAPTVPATILDPFIGSGTTGSVAQRLGRRAIGVDLSESYLKLAAKRIGKVTLPMVGL